MKIIGIGDAGIDNYLIVDKIPQYDEKVISSKFISFQVA